jgi:hypothetical protein
MKVDKKNTTCPSILKLFRTTLLLVMSIQLSFGFLIQNFLCFETDKIEYAEKMDVETEEKDSKEESEKDKMHSKLFSSLLIDEVQIHSHNLIQLGCSQFHCKIPTPPPEVS